jgi:ATP-binding cassette, subfamily C, bacterial
MSHALPIASGRRSAAVLWRTARNHPRELAAAVVSTTLSSAGTVAWSRCSWPSPSSP